ncbi:hypothetical protein ES703_118786 [subsurface metagenome]
MQKVDFVVYDSSAANLVFSYVADRNFVAFENYFSDIDSETGEFNVSMIFVLDESVGECFTSTFGFDMNSMDAKIFYNSPNSGFVLSPEMEFDIDLTEYFGDSSNILNEISIALDYDGIITFGSNALAGIFSEFALIQEEYIFYLQDKYLSFEIFELEDDNKLTLSREQILELLHFNPDNEKYYLRAKLKYDWDCILEIFTQSSMRIDITGQIVLNKYDLEVKYISFETTRISAFESSTPLDLVAIDVPNYFNDSGTIKLLPDDNDMDIGINGGFLRNVDTRQRLMIRQQLYYNFTESTSGPYDILLDQTYTDTILRFITPTGYLEVPDGDYLANSAYFSFIADYEVSNVSLYYFDGQDDIFIADMVPNNYQSNIFEYTWNGIQASTSWMTGDSVEIVFNLTDIFENTNEYRYNFTADFISPKPIIKIGDSGTENYQYLHYRYLHYCQMKAQNLSFLIPMQYFP